MDVEEDDISKLETGDVRIPKVKTKSLEKVNDGVDLVSKNRLKGIILSVTKPSYTLKRGIGKSRYGYENLRWDNRNRLRHLLQQLVRRHNWDEASGVLSVLLKGTGKEKSIWKNRTKYWAAVELLKHIKGDSINSRKVQNIYEIWMKKIGPMIHRPLKDKSVVQLEFIMFCLVHGNVEDAHQAVICLMQEREFGRDSISNFVVGLTFCELWYTDIRKNLQLMDLDEPCSLTQSKMLESGFNKSIENSVGHDAAQVHEADSPVQCDSNTSIRNDKEIGLEGVVDQHKQVPMEVDDDLRSRSQLRNIHPKGFYVHSADSNGLDSSFSNHAGNIPRFSIFHAHGLEPWLLPLRLSHTTENLEDFINMQRKIHNDHYKGAVTYLRLALYSTPPTFEALLPLIQMLLLGDQVKEALHELEMFIHNSDTALPLRIKSRLLEHFYSHNHVKLATCFEGVLKKDPTCSHSLERLVIMHRNGAYGTEKLLEMIALHLDGTYAEGNIWKEFASCFLNLSQWGEDRMSNCLGDYAGGPTQRYSSHSNSIPGIFIDGVLEKSWRFRCRWWLTRHFSHSILASEIAAGDFELVTYKAASASHLYGHENEYVVKASTCLKTGKNRDMFSFLELHMQNSVGFYSKFDKKYN